MQGAQNLRSEAYLLVRRNDEGEAQRRRWTFRKSSIINHGLVRPGHVRAEIALRFCRPIMDAPDKSLPEDS